MATVILHHPSWPDLDVEVEESLAGDWSAAGWIAQDPPPGGYNARATVLAIPNADGTYALKGYRDGAEVADLTAPQVSVAEHVTAALDMRAPRGVVIAHASDSTGDTDTEYFELAWKSALSTLWPERPARVRRWSTLDPAGYGAWATWQSGSLGTEAGTAFADDFSTDSATVIGTLSPDVGEPYTEHSSHGSYWSVSGGKLTRGGTADGTRATLRGAWNARSTPDFDFSGRVMVPASASNVEAEIMVASNTEATARVALEISGTAEATLTQYFNSTVTVLGTFPAGTVTSDVETAFSLALSGTTLTGTLGTASLTATLTQAQVDTLATTTRTVVRSQIPGVTFDDFTVSAQVPSPATVPGVDVYNGGAAGKTADYQRANLATIYPVRPDVLFINHGHNYATTVGVNEVLASIQGLVDDLHSLYPGKPIPVVITSQNPQHGTGREAQHLERMLAVRDYAARKGWGYIPTFEAFAKRPDGGADQMQDSIHPAIDTGRVLMGDTAAAWLREHSRR